MLATNSSGAQYATTDVGKQQDERRGMREARCAKHDNLRQQVNCWTIGRSALHLQRDVLDAPAEEIMRTLARCLMPSSLPASE
jgi:hypothetical protein